MAQHFLLFSLVLNSVCLMQFRAVGLEMDINQTCTCQDLGIPQCAILCNLLTKHLNGMTAYCYAILFGNNCHVQMSMQWEVG